MRRLAIIQRCKEDLFREIGACIHSIKLFHPSYIGYDANDKCLFIENAIVHPIDEDINDPRVPGKPVSASVKWVNDKLDKINYPNTDDEIKEKVIDAFNFVKDNIRWSNGEYLQRSINIATNRKDGTDRERKVRIVDIWDEKESMALETIMNSLSAISCKHTLEIDGSPAHGILRTEDNTIYDVVVIAGE